MDSSLRNFKPHLDSSSTTEDVFCDNENLSDKVAIITGANSGIGLETAKALVSRGCHVILACRSEKKTKEVISQIKKEFSDSAKVDFIHCDLASLRSVEKFCQQFRSMNLKLHYLILNAAINGLANSVTEDGLDMVFQVNYFGHFCLTNLVKDILAASSPSRVVVVSSESHRQSLLTEDNLLVPWKRLAFTSFFAYNDSKLMEILFANEVYRRWIDDGISAVSCHPGNLIYTNIQQYSWILRSLYYFASPFTKTPNQAAATVIYSMLIPEEVLSKSSKYFNNCAESIPSTSSMNTNLAAVLWNYSEDIYKQYFP